MKRTKTEERRYRREQHQIACSILVAKTALALDEKEADETEVFRLAYALAGGYSEKEAYASYARWAENHNKRSLPKLVENFCIDVLAGRIGVMQGGNPDVDDD